MLFLSHWFLVVLVLALGGERILGATTREERDFIAAANAFQDGMWSRAEVEFAQFAEKHPKSGRVAEAVLMQAEADFKQGKFLQAAQLLILRKSQAGALADQYAYWLGEAQFQNANYAAAAETFSQLTRDFTNSSWRLDAAVNEAAAREKLGQWLQVGALLREPAGTFQQAAKTNSTDERVVRGQLLLAEALLEQNKLNESMAVLHLLGSQELKPELSWQQIHLLGRVQFANGDANAALASTTNLIRLADVMGQGGLRAEGVAEQAGILEQLWRTTEAMAVYRENLSTNAPAAWQRQAILKIAELAAVQGKFLEAEQSLEKFLTQFPNSPSANVALLTLGELHLKNSVAQPAVATNDLQEAQARFDRFLDVFKDSPLAGKAYLDRGWCFWIAGKTPESLKAFKAAAQKLPPSVDLAVARFKMGDALFAQKKYTDARENYRAVVNDFTNFPAVAETLCPQALYQMLRACVELKDFTGSSNALAQILKIYPTSNLGDKSILLVGEGLTDTKHSAEARALFQKFEELFPDSPLQPEVELALARTYEQEDNWPAAISVYDNWVGHFATNALLLPQVEYVRAWANFQAGRETNAFLLFTNFIARFPSNNLAPVAQWWVGDHFFRTGDFVDAEKNYKHVFQDWPESSLAYPAKMMAGRAAMGWFGYSDAIGYFTSLTSDTNCPSDLNMQALFAYGSALMQKESTDTNNPLANFEQAIRVFKAICQSYPQTEQAALALGEIGDCDLQLTNYDAAAGAYAQVTNLLVASVAARSQAQIGIGIVFEKRAAQATGENQIALLKQARDDYYDVFRGNNLRRDESEEADPFWQKKAGLETARLDESLQEWPQAVLIYQGMTNLWPQLQVVLENKIQRIITEYPEIKERN
jgi:TolA-binding protein